MREIEATIYVTRNGLDVPVEIVADYRPGNYPVMPSFGNELGDPGDPPEVSITSSTVQGVDIELDADEEEKAFHAILDEAER